MALPVWLGPILGTISRIANGVLDAINRKNKEADPAELLGGDNGVRESDQSFEDIVSKGSKHNKIE